MQFGVEFLKDNFHLKKKDSKLQHFFQNFDVFFSHYTCTNSILRNMNLLFMNALTSSTLVQLDH